MEKLVVLIIVLLSVASTPLTLKKLIDRPKRGGEITGNGDESENRQGERSEDRQGDQSEDR